MAFQGREGNPENILIFNFPRHQIPEDQYTIVLLIRKKFFERQ
jgi:hypothetical protein